MANINDMLKSYDIDIEVKEIDKNEISSQPKQDNLLEGVYKWAQYFRRYPTELAKLWGIKLKPFQKYILTMWFRSNYGMLIATRGIGKTWLIALFCLLKMVLYPNIKIVVAAGRKGQGMKIVTEKIPEIIKNNEIINKEIKDTRTTSNNIDLPNLTMFNGSTLKVVTANDNARSARANILILDEFRMIKKDIYDSVLRKFLSGERMVGYRNKEEWRNYPMERNQEFFLTSAYYTFNWWYEKFNVFYTQMINGKKYELIALPYQMSIKSKLLNPEQLKDELEESDFNAAIFEMEMKCMPFGQSTKSYFDAESLENLRTLNYPLYPSEYYKMIDDKMFRGDLKKNGEIRLLCCDIATIGGKQNDASTFLLMRLLPDKNGYIRQIPFMTSLEGGHTLTQTLMIKRLYYALECDYIVLDRQNAGIGVYDNLVLPTFDSDNLKTYPSMCSINDDEMIKRCPYSSSENVIYTIAAYASFNDEIARDLKDVIKRKRIEFLSDKESMLDYFDHFPNYYAKTSEENKMILARTYEETNNLINEMVLLEQTTTGGAVELIKLVTVGRNRKDRYTALAYGNHIAKKLEQALIAPDESSSTLNYMKAINGSLSNLNTFKNNFKNKFR